MVVESHTQPDLKSTYRGTRIEGSEKYDQIYGVVWVAENLLFSLSRISS